MGLSGRRTTAIQFIVFERKMGESNDLFMECEIGDVNYSVSVRHKD